MESFLLKYGDRFALEALRRVCRCLEFESEEAGSIWTITRRGQKDLYIRIPHRCKGRGVRWRMVVVDGRDGDPKSFSVPRYSLYKVSMGIRLSRFE